MDFFPCVLVLLTRGLGSNKVLNDILSELVEPLNAHTLATEFYYIEKKMYVTIINYNLSYLPLSLILSVT